MNTCPKCGSEFRDWFAADVKQFACGTLAFDRGQSIDETRYCLRRQLANMTTDRDQLKGRAEKAEAAAAEIQSIAQGWDDPTAKMSLICEILHKKRVGQPLLDELQRLRKLEPLVRHQVDCNANLATADGHTCTCTCGLDEARK